MGMMTCCYLLNSEIETQANDLVAAFNSRFDRRLYANVPLEEIVETHLSLSLGFANLQEQFNSDEMILGATFLKTKEIFINEDLDPYEHPEREGRYRFTLAHEIGHWVLHVPQMSLAQIAAPRQAPIILCRSDARQDRIEWQANQFAAYLLMPKELVRIGWENMYGSSRPMIILDDLLRATKTSLREGRGTVLPAVKELARIFHVSSHAMQIRLESMGLIIAQSAVTPTLA